MQPNLIIIQFAENAVPFIYILIQKIAAALLLKFALVLNFVQTSIANL